MYRISAGELNAWKEIEIVDAAKVQLTHIRHFIEDEARSSNLPLGVEDGVIEFRKFFKTEEEDCLILYNPQHREDYYKFCVQKFAEASAAVIKITTFGSSKQLRKFQYADTAKKQLTAGYWGSQIGLDNFGELLARSAVNSIRSWGVDKGALERERKFYCDLERVLLRTFGVQ